MANREEEKNNNNPSFKGMMSGINVFTNFIENTATGKLLSCDVGVLTGRTLNARTKAERREIGIRDGGSIYFYMWAPAHISRLMNLIETGGVRSTRINPNSVNLLNEELTKFLTANGGSMDATEFRRKFLGPDKIKLPETLKFTNREKLSPVTEFFNKFRKSPIKPVETIETSKFIEFLENNVSSDKLDRLKKRAIEMSKLQPEREGISILTREQVKDVFRGGKLNAPEFLKKTFEFESGGAATNPNKYFSHKRLYKFKKEMVDYVDDLCKNEKVITAKTLSKAKSKNLALNGLNFLVGFAVSALFLSTLIPKIQYYITRKTTGVDAFPGTYDYSNQNNNENKSN